MLTAPILAWCVIAIGIVGAFALGKLAPGGFWVTLGLLFADALLGVTLTFGLYFAFAACLQVSLCSQTTDQTVWSLGFPLMFVPAYWVATLVARLSVRKEVERGH